MKADGRGSSSGIDCRYYKTRTCTGWSPKWSFGGEVMPAAFVQVFPAFGGGAENTITWGTCVFRRFV